MGIVGDANSNIEVSVLCVAYNQGKYIKTALEGFVNQITDFQFEVVVHDDASTDNTAEIIMEYQKKYPEIIKPVIQAENQYSKGRKIYIDIMLPKAKGRYIALCEGDDYWTEPHKLQMQYDALESHPECSLCVHRVQCHNEDDSINERSIPEKHYKLDKDGIIKEKRLLELYYFCKGGYPFHTSSYFFRKDILFERVDLVRDVGILRKCLINGYAYYFNTPMSVRRLSTKGNFNSRLSSGGKKALISFCLSNIQNEYNFNLYTKKKYEKYCKYDMLENAIEIGKNEPRLYKRILSTYDLSINSLFFKPITIEKVKRIILYKMLLSCPSMYRLAKRLKGCFFGFGHGH